MPSSLPSVSPTILPIVSNSVSISSGGRQDIVFLIRDVRINGVSIEGDEAPAALHSRYSGKTIQLEVIGEFGSITVSDVAAILNNGVDLTVRSVGSNRIVLSLDTTGIVDLYLAGPHLLRLRLGETILKTHILVGSPDETLIPFPQIDEVTSIVGADQQVTVLEIRGKYFPRNPYFAKATINGQTIAIQSVDVENNEDVMHLNVPRDVLTGLDSHVLAYASPFGSLQYRFQLAR